MKVSLFHDCFDNQPKVMDMTLPELHELVSTDQNVQSKQALYAFSPTVWEEGFTRGTRGISHYSFIALDFDNSDKTITGYDKNDKPILLEKCMNKPAQPELLAKYLADAGIEASIYTSFSNNKGGSAWPKFRILIPFENKAFFDTWSQTVDYVLNITGLSFWSASIDVKAVKDPAHIYFFTSGYYAPVQSWYIPGNKIKLDNEAIRAMPVSRANTVVKMSEEASQRLLDRKKGHVAISGDAWWKQVKIDIKKLDLVAFLEEKGCNVETAEPYLDGIKHKCDCPFAYEHSDGETSGAAIFLFPGKWPSFTCLHSHKVTLKEILCDSWRYQQ